MADIRQNRRIRDDFNRADEIPVNAPWTGAATFWGTMNLDGAQLVGTSSPPTGSATYWATESWDGDEAEVWATAVGSPTTAEGYRIGLMNSFGANVDGYQALLHVGVGSNYWEIRRYDNGTPTQIAINDPEPVPSEGDMVLMRRNGNDVEVWHSTDNGANWTLIVSDTDTTYTSGLYAVLGTTGNLEGWDNFGGGPHGPYRTQFFRRPLG